MLIKVNYETRNLKHLKQSAKKEIVVEPAEFDVNDNEHLVFNEDSNKLIKHIEGDILSAC